jgi:hypothetical protein
MNGTIDFRALVPADLPDGAEVLREGVEHGRRRDIGHRIDHRTSPHHYPSSLKIAAARRLGAA